MAYIEVDELDFEEVLDAEFSKGNIVILKFYTEYCDACMSLDFELEELVDTYDNISVLAIDCNESEGLANHFGIIQVPTMMIYKDKDTMILNKEGIMLASDITQLIGLKD